MYEDADQEKAQHADIGIRRGCHRPEFAFACLGGVEAHRVVEIEYGRNDGRLWVLALNRDRTVDTVMNA